jgi:hypothetical protein
MERINHTINGHRITLDRSGTLSFNGHEFTPPEVIALWLFLQAPGVAALISALDSVSGEQSDPIPRRPSTAAERAARLEAFYIAINAWRTLQGLEIAADEEIDRLIAVGAVPADVVRATWAAVSQRPAARPVGAISADLTPSGSP